MAEPTPLVRKLASELSVDLRSVIGTGVGGRVRPADVFAAAQAEADRDYFELFGEAPPPEPVAPASAAPRVLRQDDIDSMADEDRLYRTLYPEGPS